MRGFSNQIKILILLSKKTLLLRRVQALYSIDAPVDRDELFTCLALDVYWKKKLEREMRSLGYIFNDNLLINSAMVEKTHNAEDQDKNRAQFDLFGSLATNSNLFQKNFKHSERTGVDKCASIRYNWSLPVNFEF